MFTHAELLNETSALGKFAMKLTRNNADAEDLLQSSLLTALSKQSQFEHGTNLFSWISRIMFNAFVSSYRRNSRLETKFDPQIYIDQQFVEGRQESAAEVDLIGEAMTTLSSEHQEILRMVCIEGRQYAEVAETLGIPVGTVRSRLSRARSGLEEKLKVSRQNRIFSIATVDSNNSMLDIPVASEALLGSRKPLAPTLYALAM